MKISTEHYNALVNMLGDYVNKNRKTIEQHCAQVLASGKFKDYDKRIRWDILYAAVPSSWVCDNLYSYLDDSHLDSALKAALKDINF